MLVGVNDPVAVYNIASKEVTKLNLVCNENSSCTVSSYDHTDENYFAQSNALLVRTVPEQTIDYRGSLPDENPWFVGIWYAKDFIG